MEILYDVFLICKIYPRRVFWCIFIFIAAIWTTGVSIKEEKSDEEENTLIIGFFKRSHNYLRGFLIAAWAGAKITERSE